jgi:O-antigen ligase
MISKARISDKTFEYIPVILLLILAVLALPLVLKNRVNYALILFALPVIFVLLTNTRVLLYLYVITMTIFIYPVPGMILLVADYVLIGMVLAAVIDFLVNVRRHIAIPVLANNYLVLIGLMIVSALAAYFPMYSITPVLRAILQLVVLVVFYNRMRRDDIEKLAKLYFWVLAVHALFASISFVAAGGIIRIFGLAGKYSDDLIMLAFPIGLAYTIWSRSSTQARLYGFGTVVVLMGILSSQSRFPILTIIWVGLAVLIFSWSYAGKIGFKPARRRIRTALAVTVVFTAVVLAGETIFSGIVKRFDYAMSSKMGSSVLMRFSLWKTALIAFGENPILGIGPGNFRFIDTVVPSVKFVVIRYLVRGLSAHNMVLHYLAETGIFGVTALVWLYARYFKFAFNRARVKMSEFPPTIRIALLGVALTAFGEIFYMDGWMWGLTAFPVPLFMALTCRMAKEDHAG